MHFLAHLTLQLWRRFYHQKYSHSETDGPGATAMGVHYNYKKAPEDGNTAISPLAG